MQASLGYVATGRHLRVENHMSVEFEKLIINTITLSPRRVCVAFMFYFNHLGKGFQPVCVMLQHAMPYNQIATFRS